MPTSSSKPTVLLLGTAHIGNNNRDVFNTQFDDMLASRQDDRVLVIYGAGHIHLLTQFIHESDLYTLESVETYLQS